MPRTFDSHASAVAFPLGGIGTGNVSLGARGDLRDWEIFNHPQKGLRLPNTFAAISAAWPDQPRDTRVVEGPIPPPFASSHGFHPTTGAGLPRFASSQFQGEYPLAKIRFEQPDLPLEVSLEAFTPLAPLNPDNSGLPAAVFTYRVRNLAATPAAVTLVFSLSNPVGGVEFDGFGNPYSPGPGGNRSEYRAESGLRGLFFRSLAIDPADLRCGTLALATAHPRVTVKPVWLRGAWFDFLQEFWDDLGDGLLTDLGIADPTAPGEVDTGSLGLLADLAPGETQDFRFLLAWSFPNRAANWVPDASGPITRNHYAVHFDDAWAVARYLAGNIEALEDSTRRFHAALFDSSLPEAAVDALSANIVPLRSTTCFWLEDGRFFGYEGCFDRGGCCEGSCTHVWSYAQTLAYLFPSLEREMRRIEFITETDAQGQMALRSYRSIPSLNDPPEGLENPRPAVDGQMGSILRVYREWLLSGDRGWLAQVWPGVKRAISFASRYWDPDGDGLLEGEQHTTYDIQFLGPNPLGSIYYLAALKAVAALAAALDEPDLAGQCRWTADRAEEQIEARLWNGEYYVQRLAELDAQPHQLGEGCLSDQLLGQLYARVLGLSDLLPSDHLRSAAAAIYRHNFKRGFSGGASLQRSFVLGDEAGLVLCSWPHGGRPRFPFVYADEVWTGVEYEVSALLLDQGQVEEGLEIVSAVRDRHDGVRRNPWDEVECGHHYARSMASWWLLLA